MILLALKKEPLWLCPGRCLFLALTWTALTAQLVLFFLLIFFLFPTVITARRSCLILGRLEDQRLCSC